MGERPVWVGLVARVRERLPPCNLCTLPPATAAPPPCNCAPPPCTAAPLEGNTVKDNTRKEGSPQRKTNEVTFTIEEVGLTNRQVWAATLGELARRGDVGRAELDTWLRPAALIGRDGETLILGAPNAVSRDRIATRLLPAVREALGARSGLA